MTAEAIMHQEGSVVTHTADAAVASGQVFRLEDGRAGVYCGLNAAASGDVFALQTAGVHDIQKSTSVNILLGQEVWWDITNNELTYRIAGDYYVGVAQETALAAATDVKVNLNAKPVYVAEQGVDAFTTDGYIGTGIPIQCPGDIAVSMPFTTDAEAAMQALTSVATIAVADKPIMEAEVAVYDIGNDAALDICVGLANGGHDTDFDSVTEYCIIHLDGSALSVLAESEDGTTTEGQDDTLFDAVDDTYFFLQIDASTPADCQIYINGALKLTASVFNIAAATGPLVAIAHMEKTSNDTSAELRVRRMTLRRGEFAG